MAELYRARRIHTLGPAGTVRALRVEGGRVVEAGDLSARPGERVIDWEGATVVPGLWDTHLHLELYCLGLERLELGGLSLDEVLQRIQQAPGSGWILGQGWNEGSWPALPTLEALDRASRGRPLLIHRSDLHSALVNSAAFRRAGLDDSSADPPGGRLVKDSGGHLTGLIVDQAIPLISAHLDPPCPEDRARALRLGAERLSRLGLTGVVDQRLPQGEAFPLELYRSLDLPLRIHCNLAPHHLGEVQPQGGDRLRTGHVKFFSDGSMGSRTARMLEPYQGSQERGLWLTPPEELRQGFARARAAGFPISVHAIGDEALRRVLDLFAQLGPRPGVPDRIEHVQILDDQDVPRLAALGLVASMQPLHLLDDREQADRLLGPRARGYYRLASLARAGTRLGFGSDAPVADPSPWWGLQAAVERRRGQEEPWFPEERLDPLTALLAYTRKAAAGLGWGQLAGSLEPGKVADLAVLDRDPLEGEDLGHVQVLQTAVGGRQVP